ALADQPRQPLRPAEPGHDPEVDLRLAEGRRLGGDPEVTRHRQLAAPAERERVDRRDRHGRGLLHPGHQPVAGLDQLGPLLRGVHLRELLDVGPGREGERVRRRDHHGTRLPVQRSEEHTSELQSLRHLVCRLLLEKKKNKNITLLRSIFFTYFTSEVIISLSISANNYALT